MTMVMLKQYFYSQTKRTKQITSVLVVLIVAAVGTYLLVGSHAATPYAYITADKGTLANGATKQTCSGSSDGSCVVFGGSTPACTQTLSPGADIAAAISSANAGAVVCLNSGTY